MAAIETHGRHITTATQIWHCANVADSAHDWLCCTQQCEVVVMTTENLPLKNDWRTLADVAFQHYLDRRHACAELSLFARPQAD
jgi:hypothetical protein